MTVTSITSSRGHPPKATRKGDLALALGLGLIIVALSLVINVAAFLLRDAARQSR